MNARHRVSKILLMHGQVYAKPGSTWTKTHRQWLGAQQSVHLELSADWNRFEKAHRVGSWLGLTPSRQQSGESDHHGSITKTGSTLARRLLVEAAWHYARQPSVGATLAARQEGQPDHVLQIANRAQQRVHRTYTRMKSRSKPHNVTVVACARELACFMWAVATAP